MVIFLPRGNRLYWPKTSSVSKIHYRTQTHHSRYDSSGRVIGPTQRPPPHNTQHAQQTDIHASGAIRTHDPSKRGAAGLLLRPRGHWDQQMANSKMDFFYWQSVIFGASCIQTDSLKQRSEYRDI